MSNETKFYFHNGAMVARRIMEGGKEMIYAIVPHLPEFKKYKKGFNLDDGTATDLDQFMSQVVKNFKEEAIVKMNEKQKEN